MSLKGKRALITGGTKGIGRAIALTLAQEGVHVAVNYFKSRDAAERTVKELQGHGVDALSIRANVGNLEHLQKIFDQVKQRFGGLDIFISNAASGVLRPAMQITELDWQFTMEANARAFLMGAQRAATLMQDKGGSIIGISSLGPIKYTPEYTLMAAAKACIQTMVRYLAFELGPKGINVNAVAGGIVDTESLRMFPRYEQMVEFARRYTPAGRIGQPEDIAPVVVFLCTEGARWINGQVIVVDGGYSLL
jgi:enoyl-[acyl-carrier protein] reductase III